MPPGIQKYKEALRLFRINYWTALLGITGGNVREAARIAQVSPEHLYASLRELGVRPGRDRISNAGTGARGPGDLESALSDTPSADSGPLNPG